MPAEILGLAGLLKMPEVVEVLAYARATLDPLASVALAPDPARPAVPRRLQGPRARRLARQDEELRASARRTRPRARPTPFLFAEALEQLDEVEGLSDGGRARLEECRAGAGGAPGRGTPPGRGVPRRDHPAHGHPHRARRRTWTWRRPRRRRRNLAAFLDEVHAFSPVQGELTLRAFLDYVDAVENLDKQEWSPVQPSEEDSVKVMTIHVAKGLEFDHVFVPGLAKGLLPNTTIQHNPAERGKSMDFELRGDAAYPAPLRRQPVRASRRS